MRLLVFYLAWLLTIITISADFMTLPELELTKRPFRFDTTAMRKVDSSKKDWAPIADTEVISLILPADATRKMQQYLRLLNMRLNIVVKDITGQTGLTIIEAICKGQKDAETLASLRNYNCRKSKQDIAKAEEQLLYPLPQ